MKNRTIGSIMIVVGTTIGAGILGFATESAGAGFPLAAISYVSHVGIVYDNWVNGY